MNREDVKDILTRYRTDTCTEAERQLVERWIVHGSADPLDLSDDQLLEDLLAIRLRLERDFRAEKATMTYRFRRWLPYVAAIVFLLSAGLWLFRDQWTGSKQPSTESQLVDIAPGGNRATLTLADGRTVNLSVAQKGIVIGDGVTYLDGSKLVENGNMKTASTFNSITTPKGGTYQIKLADGTTVWLNSASTLKYPSHFDKKERVVELQGEAYFDVRSIHSTPTPFRVITPGHAVEVLGTQFNISAYAEDVETKTTLVAGRVRVQTVGRTTNHTAVLQPGQQSTVSESGVAVNDVDVSPFIGWKDGFFIFKGTELREAMKQIGRWYNVEVIYEGFISPTPFYGKISREDTLAEVLAILKEGNINFRIEQQATSNRLVVMP